MTWWWRQRQNALTFWFVWIKADFPANHSTISMFDHCFASFFSSFVNLPFIEMDNATKFIEFNVLQWIVCVGYFSKFYSIAFYKSGNCQIKKRQKTKFFFWRHKKWLCDLGRSLNSIYWKKSNINCNNQYGFSLVGYYWKNDRKNLNSIESIPTDHKSFDAHNLWKNIYTYIHDVVLNLWFP